MAPSTSAPSIGGGVSARPARSTDARRGAVAAASAPRGARLAAVPESAASVAPARRVTPRASAALPAATTPAAVAPTRPAAASARGIASVLDNRAPTASPSQSGQNGNIVTGVLNASDADDDPVGYTVVEDPEHGSVTIGSGGAYIYTADPALAATGTVDSFRVAVSDAGSGFHVHGLLGLINLLTLGLIGSSGHTTTTTVGVTVAPFGTSTPVNRPPTGTASVGTPDPVTGVVTGAVLGTDPDGDTLTYSAPATTAKGAVGIGAGNGQFIYTPTLAARQNSADLQDSFTVTIADGHGGSGAVLVAVAIAPAVVTPDPDPDPDPGPDPDPDPDPGGPLAAFPGAEGFGSFATGGRDGTVIYVTNLNASGPGSLQWAIDQPGAKYILFKVSGVINTQIHLTNGDVTIAGQTSPGGITIRGFVTDETPYQDQTVRAPSDFAENWILQHIRIRPGQGGPSDDGLRIRYTRNAIIDHVSIGNATDEAIEISYSSNITVQNTLIAETVGGHSEFGGVLMN
ncbi:MAG TPA: Ig-like domain-containing protein, partial [Mycobacterium sp.]|nr:Ig-like domain-containing protein [Mycobacterium sp.]